jgi:hypothetical protein
MNTKQKDETTTVAACPPLSGGLTTNKKKVLDKNPDAYIYISLGIYHIAESTRQCAPSIGSGKTEANVGLAVMEDLCR